MRSFAIVALCLVAAWADAASMRDIRQCVIDELKGQVEQIREEVDCRLKKIAEEGDKSAAKVREEFDRKAEEFQEAMTKPLDQARSNYENCVNNAGGFFDKARCVVITGRELITEVIPIVSEKTSELAESVNEIAIQFRDDNRGNFDDLREKGRELVKDVIAAVKDCATH